MPPKMNKKVNITVDKTFGMKNKNKSAKVQQEAARMQAAQSRKGKSPEDLRAEERRKADAAYKVAETERKKQEALLNKPVQAQKVPFGVDPKTILCQYFKAGFCEKGTKCKFSHDKDVGRRVEKRNLYSDERDGAKSEFDPNDKKTDTMDKWDEEKLRNVVLSKTGNPKTTTDIVCKHFIQAVEDQKYGWFWDCPNGENCKYRHALPPGFVLDSDKKKKEAAAKANVITLEEFLESERHKLGKDLTPVTAESFAIWKKTRMDKKMAEDEVKAKLKEGSANSGKLTGLSGRDLFTFNPDWFVGDEDSDDGEAHGDEWDISQFKRENSDDEDADGQTSQSDGVAPSASGTGLEGSVKGMSVAGDGSVNGDQQADA